MTDSAFPTPDATSYMAVVAGSEPGREYKALALRALDLSAGHFVVDVGCGPGTDLATLAAAVVPAGSVLGIDRDESMLVRAASVAAGSRVKVRLGDAHALPLADAVADRVRTDRVLQHVEDPGHVMAEVKRVLRPGGRAVFAEPDWDTLAIAAEDVGCSGRYRDFVRDVAVRNGRIGRQLARHASAAGLRVRSVTVSAGVFTDHGVAEAILGMSRNVERAIASGHLTDDARRWAASLTVGPFVAALSMFVVTVERASEP